MGFFWVFQEVSFLEFFEVVLGVSGDLGVFREFILVFWGFRTGILVPVVMVVVSSRFFFSFSIFFVGPARHLGTRGVKEEERAAFASFHDFLNVSFTLISLPFFAFSLPGGFEFDSPGLLPSFAFLFSFISVSVFLFRRSCSCVTPPFMPFPLPFPTLAFSPDLVPCVCVGFGLPIAFDVLDVTRLFGFLLFWCFVMVLFYL